MKVKIKSSRKLVIVLISLVLTTIVVFVGLPKIVEREEALIEIVRVNEMVEENVIIEESMLSIVKVGKYNLPSNVIQSKDEVIGKYSKISLLPTDNLVPEKFQDTKSNKDQYLYDLEKDKVCVSITVPSLASALSGKLQEGDIVKIYVYKKENPSSSIGMDGAVSGTGTGTIMEFNELKYVEVVGITNSKSEDIKDVTEAIEEEKKKSANTYSSQNSLPGTIVFKCYPEQAKKLIEAENLGKIHVAFVARDQQVKESLLLEQMKILGRNPSDNATTQQEAPISPTSNEQTENNGQSQESTTATENISVTTNVSTGTSQPMGNVKEDVENKNISFTLD